MSHKSTIKAEIRDIEAVKAMCKEKGWTFKENATEYKGWMYTGTCNHAIAFPDCRFEVGLQKTATGAYQMECDDHMQSDSHLWKNETNRSSLGQNGGRFMQLYGIHKATLEAKRLGYTVQRVPLENNRIKLRVTGNF